MAQFLVQFSYASRSFRQMVDRPDADHAAEAAALVESVGGKLLGYWLSLGAFDGVVLIEAPDNSVAASIAIAIGGSGEVSRFQTVALLTTEEARQAARKAASATHLPPGQERG